MQCYLGELTLYDHQIGRVLAVLDELGLADDTLVGYTADHGDMCGSHGMIDKQYIMYDDVVRVPLIVRWPGRIAPGGVCDAMTINTLDLPYTFVGAAGGQPPATFAGRDLLAGVDGTDPQPRQDVYAIFVGNQFGLLSQRMVRDRRFKYVWNSTAQDELYDLQNDPGEITNLAQCPEHAGELQRLRHRLVHWMDETDDKLLNQWTRTQLEQGLTI